MDAHSSKMMPADDRPGTVLQIISGLGVGGAERVVLELSKKLDQQGWRVVIVSLDGNRKLLEQYHDFRIPVYSLGVERNAWSVLKVLPKLFSIVRSEQPAIIHAHMFHGLLAALICRAIIPNAKIVFTSHSFGGFGQVRSWLIRAVRRLRAADVIFAAGQHPTLNAKNIEIIPNGVCIVEQQSPLILKKEIPFLFVFVGRLTGPKNLHGLIVAFGRMRHRDCHLWIVGEGPLRPQIEHLIGELRLVDRVKLLGARTDVSELLRLADCFVMASFWEGLPMALLEAGALGLPVIAPPVGAIPQLLGGGCGFVTEVPQLTKTLDAVVDAPHEARACGMRLRDRILAGYTVESMANKHIELYQKIGSRRRSDK